MQTKSYISAAALAAALLATPQWTLAQGLELDLGVLGVDAKVGVGLDDGLAVNADVTTGGAESGGRLVDVDLGTASSSSESALVDLDIGSTKGPNGGTLISLGTPNADDMTATDDGSRLLSGDIRIGALDGDSRRDALLERIDSPNLADIDLDSAIDDRRVSIVAAADLLGTDDLADISAALQIGGDGRAELRDALAASAELGAILGNEGIDLDDVLAVQVAENGATDVIVLRGPTRRALADDGNLADVTLADLSADELANLDLDLMSHDDLAALDLDLLPNELATAVQVRLLGDDGFSDSSVSELATLSVASSPADDTSADDTSADDTAGNDAGGGDDNGNGTDATGTDDDNGAGSSANGGDDDAVAEGDATAAIIPDTLPATTVGAGFGIAALGCDVGVLALATGLDATPQAIAMADSLELVRIDGCERSLVDADIAEIHSAIVANPAISDVLDDGDIPLDEVIGATIQGGTLTLFIDPVVS